MVDVMAGKPKLRLHVAADLEMGAAVPLDQGQHHYAVNVMRAEAGARALVFNGRHGEWLGHLEILTKKLSAIRLVEQTRAQNAEPDIWLLFSPLKKAATDDLVEKAVELGVARILPVMTRRTNAERMRIDRLMAIAKEAAEQCERLTIPDILEPQPLARLLGGWDNNRHLYFCDEAGTARPLGTVIRPGPAALLIGPEGGFDESERIMIGEYEFATAGTLGPRILRAPTAAASALTIWQTVAGDWG